MQTLYDFVTTYQQSPFKYLISDVPKDNKRSGSSSGMKRQPGEVQSYDSLSKIGSLSTTFSFKYLSSLGVGEHLLTRLPIKSIKSAPPEILSAFTPPSSPPKVQPQAILKLSKLVGAGDVGTVFGAVLGDGSEIVLKYSISDKVIEDVEFEAELYAHLSTTPLATKLARSFGLWSGGYDDDGVVLILENVGEPLKDEIQDYPESERRKLYETVEGLHSQGFLHGDVSKRNVVVSKSRELCLIDFSHASMDHECMGVEECYELKAAKELFGV